MLLVKRPYFVNHGFRFSFGNNMTIKTHPYMGKKIVLNQMIENTCIIFAKNKKKVFKISIENLWTP